MNDFTSYFLYIPGIVIFLLGSSMVRDLISQKRVGGSSEATVISCDHVIKMDSKGREHYNYYNVTVELVNKKTKHKERHAIKSPTEYAVSQLVRVQEGAGGKPPVITENKGETRFHPVVIMAEGAILILLALFQLQSKTVPAMACLSTFLIIAGLNLIFNYVHIWKSNIITVKSTITEVYARQISKETKLLKGEKFTYYPIVKYELDGKPAFRRCNVNSGSQKNFKPGESLDLYYDVDKRRVFENKPGPGSLIGGALLVLVGIITLVF